MPENRCSLASSHKHTTRKCATEEHVSLSMRLPALPVRCSSPWGPSAALEFTLFPAVPPQADPDDDSPQSDRQLQRQLRLQDPRVRSRVRLRRHHLLQPVSGRMQHRRQRQHRGEYEHTHKHTSLHRHLSKENDCRTVGALRKSAPTKEFLFSTQMPLLVLFLEALCPNLTGMQESLSAMRSKTLSCLLHCSTSTA